MTLRLTILRRLGTLVVLVLGTLLLGSAPAWAHSRLTGTDPAAGTRLDAPPASVSLTFNEPVQLGFTTISVVGPDGNDYRTGEVTEVDTTISVPVLPLGPAGTYELGYRVVSADGHPVSGLVPFDLAKAGPGSTAARPAAGVAGPAGVPPDGGSAPVWPWFAGAAVLVGVGATVVLRTGRR